MTKKHITLMQKIDAETRSALDSGVLYLMLGLVAIVVALSAVVRV